MGSGDGTFAPRTIGRQRAQAGAIEQVSCGFPAQVVGSGDATAEGVLRVFGRVAVRLDDLRY